MYSEHGSGAASPTVAKLPRLAERTFARDYCYLGYLSNMMEELATTIMLTGRLRLWAGPRLTCLPGAAAKSSATARVVHRVYCSMSLLLRC